MRPAAVLICQDCSVAGCDGFVPGGGCDDGGGYCDHSRNGHFLPQSSTSLLLRLSLACSRSSVMLVAACWLLIAVHF